jgi:Legume lectin domain/PEP-CTERM motif
MARLLLAKFVVMQGKAMTRRMGIAAFTTTLLTAGFLALPANANVISYPNFSSTAGLTLVGQASTPTTSDGTVLRVSPGVSGFTSGAAYSNSSIPLGSNDIFSTTFQFRFTSPGGIDPADGITFVLAQNPTGLGGPGVGMGYSGVPNSVAIEFDTYNNAGFGLGNNDGNSSNHVSIDTDGQLNNLDITNVYGNGSCGFPTGSPPQNNNNVFGCMSNGDVWTVNIGYDGTDLNVFIQDGSGAVDHVIDNYAIDIASFLGTDDAFVGFTSGTGSGWENHDILNWQFADTTQLTNPIPEPFTLSLFGAGLAGAAVMRRRKKAQKA